MFPCYFGARGTSGSRKGQRLWKLLEAVFKTYAILPGFYRSVLRSEPPEKAHDDLPGSEPESFSTIRFPLRKARKCAFFGPRSAIFSAVRDWLAEQEEFEPKGTVG